MAKYRHIVFDVDGTLIDTRDCILYSLQEMLMTVKGERYEIEDLKFVLANTSVKNMHLLGVEEEKIPGAVEMWVANEEKNIDMIRIFDGIEELLEKLAEYKPLAKIEELEEQNYNMIDERLNNGVGKFNCEEEKKEQQEKSEARSSLKERLAAKQKEATQGNNKDTKELEKSKNSHREM